MCNHLVFRYYPISCQFRKIKTLGSTEPAGIGGVHFLEAWLLRFVNRLRSENFQISTRMNFAQIIQNVTRIDHEVTNFRIQNQFCNFCLGKNVAERLPEAFRVCLSDSLVNFGHLSDRFSFFNLEFNLFLSFTVCRTIKSSEKWKL